MRRFLFGLGALAAAAPAFAQAVDAPAWQPAPAALKTRWAGQVDPATVHPEYPRPQLVRERWVNLNGLWDHAVRPTDGARPESFDGPILVPFPIESALSGVKKGVKPDETLWYRRTFDLERPAEGTRFLLHFGAVDWEAVVHVNGKEVGRHKGGYDPFTFDVTDALDLDREGQEIVVAVTDPTDSGSQPRGKQVLKPEGIWYTPVTGIWQTVWLEPVPEKRIDALKIVPDVDGGRVLVTPTVVGGDAGEPVRVVVFDGDAAIAEVAGPAGEALAIPIPDPKLWGPDSPFLYDLKATVGDDAVGSYFGLRKIALGKDEAGVLRLMLNDKPLFQYGPLDQGWWPDGLYTAPTDEALKYDLDVTKRLNFNMVRKHVKVEPARWYRHCDEMGLLVWQDMPSGDNKDDASKEQFGAEWKAIIDALHNHPSIVMWVPFNEGWGQHDTERVVAWTKEYDPTRLVNNASGWTDKGVGDVNDMHNYPGPGIPALEESRAAVLGEFGGLGLPLEGHVLLEKGNWGYVSFKNTEELADRYLGLVHRLKVLAGLGLGAAVYTQTTDVEIEVNGFMTYDREVMKLPVEQVAAAHAGLYDATAPLKSEVLIPTAQASPQEWKYTTEAPAEGWEAADFDDSAWPTGLAGFGTKETPNTAVHTEWTTPEIRLRKEIELAEAPTGEVWLWIHHDDEAEIFFNGRSVARLGRWVTNYEFVPLPAEAARELKAGKNVVAVSCRQDKGGQYIDVGVIEVKQARP